MTWRTSAMGVNRTQREILLRFGVALILIVACVSSLSAWFSFRHAGDELEEAVSSGAKNILYSTAGVAQAMLKDYDMAMLAQLQEIIARDRNVLFLELRRPDGGTYFVHGQRGAEMLEFSSRIETYGKYAATLTLGYSLGPLRNHLRHSLIYAATTVVAEVLLIIGLILLLFRAELLTSMRLEVEKRRRAEGDQRFIQFVLDAMDQKIIVALADGRILMSNRRAVRLHPGETSFKNLSGVALSPDGGSPRLDQLVRDLACAEMGATRVHHYHFEGDSGTLMEVAATQAGIYLGSKEPLVVLTITDISARRETFRKLKLFSTLFENTSEAILITDKYARIVEVNQAYTQLTGYLAQDVLGKQPDLFREDQSDPGLFARLLDSLLQEGAWAGVLWYRTKSGEREPYLVSVNIIRNEDGAVVNMVAIMRDISEMRNNEERLEKIAFYDHLTGLANRLLFRRTLEREVLRDIRHNRHWALMLIDLDRFKSVNDTFGHDAGDRLLVEAARRLQECVRPEDMVARLGGDEFVVLLVDLGERRVIERIAARMVASLAEPVNVGAAEPARIGASIGIAIFPLDGVTEDELIREADAAMYEAKKAGRNGYRFVNAEQERT